MGMFQIGEPRYPRKLNAGDEGGGNLCTRTSTEIKKRNVDPSKYKGTGLMLFPYQPLFESMSIYDLGSPQAFNDLFSRWISPLNTGLSIAPEEVLDLENWRCELRLNKFKFSPEEIGDYGLHWHTDGGFLNVLQDDDEIDGLEAGTLLPIALFCHSRTGTFFINIGDVAHVWSNGRFENVKHHVKCNVATPRYSTSTFLLAPRDRNVEAGKEFVDSDHPPLFTPFKFESYADIRKTTNLIAGEALEYFLRSHPAENTSEDPKHFRPTENTSEDPKVQV
ncbi:hypothetical protein K1719_022990 [Acacia pycnantha]|nr:hypothetical protein K1719_022990 [Acacia pycnantha]